MINILRNERERLIRQFGRESTEVSDTDITVEESVVLEYDGDRSLLFASVQDPNRISKSFD